MACCWRANGTGGGGGGSFATTARLCTTTGGLAAADPPVPSTACLAGATAGVKELACAVATSRSLTRIAFFATGCAEVNACDVVAVTAPGTLWLTYV